MESFKTPEPIKSSDFSSPDEIKGPRVKKILETESGKNDYTHVS